MDPIRQLLASLRRQGEGFGLPAAAIAEFQRTALALPSGDQMFRTVQRALKLVTRLRESWHSPTAARALGGSLEPLFARLVELGKQDVHRLRRKRVAARALTARQATHAALSLGLKRPSS